jgi:N-acyl-D-aspartate/D-glutamate deacylase
MVMPSRGVEYTIVNGEIAYADGRATGATSGAVLRS